MAASFGRNRRKYEKRKVREMLSHKDATPIRLHPLLCATRRPSKHRWLSLCFFFVNARPCVYTFYAQHRPCVRYAAAREKGNESKTYVCGWPGWVLIDVWVCVCMCHGIYPSGKKEDRSLLLFSTSLPANLVGYVSECCSSCVKTHPIPSQIFSFPPVPLTLDEQLTPRHSISYYYYYYNYFHFFIPFIRSLY